MVNLVKMIEDGAARVIDRVIETPRFRKVIERIVRSELGLDSMTDDTTLTTSTRGTTTDNLTNTPGGPMPAVLYHPGYHTEAPRRRNGKIPDLHPTPAAQFAMYSREVKRAKDAGEVPMSKDAFFAADLERRRLLHASLAANGTTGITSTETTTDDSSAETDETNDVALAQSTLTLTPTTTPTAPTPTTLTSTPVLTPTPASTAAMDRPTPRPVLMNTRASTLESMT